MKKAFGLTLVIASLSAATLYYLFQTKELPARPELPSKPDIANSSSIDELRNHLGQKDRIMDDYLVTSDKIVEHNYGVFKTALVIGLGGTILGLAFMLFGRKR